MVLEGIVKHTVEAQLLLFQTLSMCGIKHTHKSEFHVLQFLKCTLQGCKSDHQQKLGVSF